MKKYVLTLFFIWNLATLLIYPFADYLLPSRGQFSYNDISTNKNGNPIFLWHRANFDGIHYINIAEKGYSVNQQAFFPLYPRLIKAISPIFGGRYLLSGLAISLISTIVALWFFYKLILLDYSDKIARRTLFLYLIFPTSFFLGAIYTEGLFVALIITTFYAARKGKWWLAGLLGMLAANTRIIGVLIFPALLYEAYQQGTISSITHNLSWIKMVNIKLRPLIHNTIFKIQPIVRFLPLFLIPMGLLFYMRYLLISYHDPLMFLHVQPAFVTNRSDGEIVLIYQVFWRYLKMILTTKPDPLYVAVWLELLVSSGVIGLIAISLKRKIRTSYLLFTLMAFSLPTLTGTFSSVPRYSLCLFPLFIALGLVENKVVRWAINIVFCVLLIVSYAMFSRGYWIA